MTLTKQLIVVGDRVLIRPDEAHDRTSAGLYLPPGVKEKEKVQRGEELTLDAAVARMLH